jgi:hypothetical protein
VSGRLVAVSTGRARQAGVRRGRPFMSAIFEDAVPPALAAWLRERAAVA